MQLYGAARSSAAFRVRIGLNLKGITAKQTAVNLRTGDRHATRYRALNPQGFVPILVDGDATLTQSLAILDYLDETHPKPPFLPAAPAERARVRALALAVACDIHPLNNLRVLTHLETAFGLGEADRLAWYRHWIAEGLSALEAMTGGHPATGAFCHGDAPTMADICLVPQIVNAKRYDCPLDDYPTLTRIFDTCMRLPAFENARPERQPDFA
jgi:maleylacetoacetate isomerase